MSTPKSHCGLGVFAFWDVSNHIAITIKSYSDNYHIA